MKGSICLGAIMVLGLMIIETVASPLWSTFGQDEFNLMYDTTDPLPDPNEMVDTRLAVPPAMDVKDRGGWISRWLSVGGEGEISVIINKDTNLTFPHRPSAFPNQVLHSLRLPIQGRLELFVSFLNGSDSTLDSRSDFGSGSDSDSGTLERDISGQNTKSPLDPNFGCYPPPIQPRYSIPAKPYRIALIERGGCDFAAKVASAQMRGAAGVIVGDGKLRDDESDEQGRKRETLITMFSPEDTDSIYIPSVFVSRASFLDIRDLLRNQTQSYGHNGLWIEIGPGSDDGGTLGSLLSFALLMPTVFLLATISIHRVRAARVREAERAPPLVVLSLPERVWSPDIVWEKDSDSETNSTPTTPRIDSTASSDPTQTSIPPPPHITPSEISTPPPFDIPEPIASGSKDRKSQAGVNAHSGKKYFGKDECAICMDSFHRGEIVRILPCGHVFHKDECDEWLLKWRKLCPTCRADVTLPPGENVQGSTLTPVAPPGEVVPGQGTLRERLLERARLSWNGVVGRRVEPNQTGETTPLVQNVGERQV